jgi:hypothetical protein
MPEYKVHACLYIPADTVHTIREGDYFYVINT